MVVEFSEPPNTTITLPLDAVTLWAAHSWARDEDGRLVFRATPRLYLLSSEPGSGKTRVLELLNLICPATHDLTIEPTAPGLVKTIGQERERFERELARLDELGVSSAAKVARPAAGIERREKLIAQAAIVEALRAAVALGHEVQSR